MRLRPDPFIVALLGAAVLASLLPVTGAALDALRAVSVVAIGLLFFLYGLRLSTAETLAGLRSWRLQAAILATTFVVMPLLGLGAQVLEPTLLTPGLAAGVLLLCLVPSTVQGCVVFTRIARGNVAAAVVSASLSNLVGVLLTPALVALLMTSEAAVDAGAVLRIVLQLLAPFLLGQLLRPVLGRWAARHEGALRVFDRSSIVLIVLVAFSEGAQADVWAEVSLLDAVVVGVLCAALLALVIGWTQLAGRVLRLGRADRVALLFCGSHKSLASGLPIASVLFASGDVALVVLPLMLYHQLQLLTGAVLAPRLVNGRRADE